MGVPEILVRGLGFPEGPRWHDGRLWFADIRRNRVMTLDADGTLNTVVELKDRPSGLGFQPDGSLLIVSMHDRVLLSLHNGHMTVHADLGEVGGQFLNDMAVAPDGGAYIGTRSAGGPETLVYVPPEGGMAWVVASGLTSPNGIAIVGDTLILAETRGQRPLAFDRRPDGGLSHQRVFAELPGTYPDGICANAAGGIWLGSPYSTDFVYVSPRGNVAARVTPADGVAVACALGGDEENLLYLACCDASALNRVWSDNEQRFVYSPEGPTSSGTIQLVRL